MLDNLGVCSSANHSIVKFYIAGKGTDQLREAMVPTAHATQLDVKLEAGVETAYSTSSWVWFTIRTGFPASAVSTGLRRPLIRRHALQHSELRRIGGTR
jgi:hypothetical protein